MWKEVIRNPYDYSIYPLYMVISCLFTAGLNIVHTKYILQIEPNVELFIVPVAAGLIFGYLTARIRLTSYRVADHGEFQVFAKYILFSCLVTAALNVVHTEWVLNKPLSLELFIAPVIAGVFFGYLLARVKTLNNKLMRLATTDIMTKLCNRMQFDNILSREIEKTKRYGGTFSVIYFDIDNFKTINDQFGHHIGDQVLTALADHINRVKRKSDIVARYGGDEFIILAPASELGSAQRLAELLKSSIEKMELQGLPRFSCSFGVVQYSQQQSSTDSLLLAVDKALYQAKHLGRNSVVAALS